MLRPLPTSTATFRKIIEGNYLYIDKTKYLYELVHSSTGAYFLSRPRRFGKSLLISTLEELFRGNRELFQGLWIDSSDYEWEPHPVIRIDFNRNPTDSPEHLKASIDYYIGQIAAEYGIELQGFDPFARFDNLIYQLGQQKQVVILIDEYDKPLIDNLDDLETAVEVRKTLKSFYAVIKGLERYVRMVFITGISKFSKVSIFSELNHLDDLTFDERFGTMLGITQTELTHHFQDRLPKFAAQENLTIDELLERIRLWYDGFRFTPQGENLYNPYSTMLLFDKFSFHNYWFESGTPTFLINLIKNNDYDLLRFNSMQVREIAFSTYELENLSVVPLLYQTGYLTIKDYDHARRRYTLAYPNQEVEESFLTWLLGAYGYIERGLGESYLWELIDALEEQNLQEVFDILGVFFANIPYDLQVKQEKYYQTVFYLIFMLIGFRVEAEIETNDGRIDAVIEVPDHIYLFEFKLDKSADEALTQIQNHAYFQKYQRRGKPVTCIGANFNTKTRTVDDWKPLASDQTQES